ncbi:enoyl-CoA hydratase/isomerase family protein [Haloarcula litorea]|uniref:enoyl-CoA hydratase/isomerase family protein n=1 Tax=Haloarcula litorea TaxID=3032579 RepID=UPI0023E8FAC8|nr:enoyl-CoA hydratase/isomerase family protein [Halomicroarcula sp. GDY20]
MIRTTAAGDVRVVTLARPERRNALDRDALRDLAASVAAATEPVLYLRGEGAAFCAGADLSVVRDLDAAAAAEFAALGQRVAATIEAYDGAVVAGIDGPARGGGVELALACDLRVATPEATLAEPGVALGLFGAWGGTHRLPRVVGESAALDLALSGRVVDADEARRLGLVSRVVADPRAAADDLAAVDHRALRRLKRLFRDRRADRAARRRAEARERAAFADLAPAADP